MDYDFQTLSPDDFEKLIADLFSMEWGTVLESYKSGKDSGIDILHSRIVSDEPNTIFQCKRHLTNNFSQLNRSFKKELPNLEKLRPERYIIATSISLSKDNKEKLIETLSPWVRCTGDIYGQSEINILLRKHPQVIRAHFKLWISSTESLEAIFHSKIFNQTYFTLEEMKNEMCKIVLHDGYERALSVLEERRHCIIAGNPGIGKTTLAKVLLCHYSKQGYEPVIVHNDITDAWALISRQQQLANRKLAILYDDFLGQTKYDSLKFGKNEDNSLVQLVRFVESVNNIIFIMTSREYIIADARLSHGVFDASADTISKCTINLTDYTKSHRAKVLFNHLYFSNLPIGKIKAIVDSKLYLKIILHKNFNPRIIAAISNRANTESLNVVEFLDFVKARLDNPSDIWGGPFTNEIMPISRWVLVVLWTLGGTAELSKLKQAVLELSNIAYPPESALDFNKSLKELMENFITSDSYGHAIDSRTVILISFQNPSISDYIESFFRSENNWIGAVASRAIFFSQYQQILTVIESQPSEFSSEIANGLLARYMKFGSKAMGVTYRGGDGVLVFTDKDIFTENEKTLTILKLSALTPSLGAEFKVEQKIVTQSGWTEDLEGLASRRSIPYSIFRLVNWLKKSVYWKLYEADIKKSFYRSFIYCINSQPDWCKELSTLNLLHECVEILDIELSLLDKLKIQHDANIAATTILLTESDIKFLEEAAEHLEQLQNRTNNFATGIAAEIRLKAESMYLTPKALPSNINNSVSAITSEELELETFFLELLHKAELDSVIDEE